MMTSLRIIEGYSICKLTQEHQKELASAFDCGNIALSAFIKSPQALDCSFGTTYVMVTRNYIIGYYNISTGHIAIPENPEFVRVGGTIYINCFAVDKNYQRIKLTSSSYISDMLLADCIRRITKIRENHVGFSFISLASTKEGHYLYERNGFFDIEDDMKIDKNPGELTCKAMYLPLDFE